MNTTPASSVKSTPPRHSVLCTPSLSVNVTLPSSVKSTSAWHGVLCTPKLSVLHGTTDAHHIWCAVSTFVLRVQGTDFTVFTCFQNLSCVIVGEVQTGPQTGRD